MSEFDLNALVKHGLSWKEPDPHVVARRLVPMIPAGERDQVLADVLVAKVREALRFERAASQATPAKHVESSSKWKRYAPVIQDRYFALGGWKFYEELTVDDCEFLADNYRQRAEANAAAAERFRRLAVRLREMGARTVADLGDDMELAA